MSAAERCPESPGPCDVLVIDDEPVVREGVRRILEAAGLRVATAADGAAAVAHPALTVCRLALCDLILPDGTGPELLHALRRSRPGLPVVVMSGLAASEQADQALQAGASDFLAKPFEESELLEVVRRMLNATAAREARS